MGSRSPSPFVHVPRPPPPYTYVTHNARSLGFQLQGLDIAEQIALDALWQEYVKETNEINLTGSSCEDDSTGESYN